jgi:hypothetical protein
MKATDKISKPLFILDKRRPGMVKLSSIERGKRQFYEAGACQTHGRSPLPYGERVRVRGLLPHQLNTVSIRIRNPIEKRERPVL